MPHLLRLPVEVMGHIARQARGDMRQLRLVHREVEQAIFTVFKQTFFSCRLIYLSTEKDLRALIDILDHTNLRPALKRLEICIDEINEFPYGKPRNLAAKKAKVIRDKKRDLHLLTNAFCKMRKHGIKLEELVVSERGGQGKAPASVGACHAYNIVLEAIDLSDYRLEHFSLTTPYFWSLPAHHISDKSPLPSTLKTLKWNARFEERLVPAADVVQRLIDLPHLVNLDFEDDVVGSESSTEVEFGVNGLAAAIVKQNFPALKRLKLTSKKSPFLNEDEQLTEGAHIRFEELVNFVKRHEKLERLDLKEILVDGRDEWDVMVAGECYRKFLDVPHGTKINCVLTRDYHGFLEMESFSVVEKAEEDE